MKKAYPGKDHSGFENLYKATEKMKLEFTEKLESVPYVLNKADIVTADYLQMTIKEGQEAISMMTRAKLLEFGMADQVKKLDEQIKKKEKEWADERAKHASKIADLERRIAAKSTSSSSGGGSKPCFAKDTIVQRLVGEKLEPCQIQDIKRGDKVLAQHSDGSISAERIEIIDEYEANFEMLTFMFSNGKRVTISDNHCLMVVSAEDTLSDSTDMDKLVVAGSAEVGMCIRAVDERLEVSTTEIVSIKRQPVTGAINIIGYHWNVVANDLVISSHVEDDLGIPRWCFSVGRAIYRMLGPDSAVTMIRRYEQFFLGKGKEKGKSILSEPEPAHSLK